MITSIYTFTIREVLNYTSETNVPITSWWNTLLILLGLRREVIRYSTTFYAQVTPEDAMRPGDIVQHQYYDMRLVCIQNNAGNATLYVIDESYIPESMLKSGDLLLLMGSTVFEK
jgi:hypothetical protein